MIGYQFYLKYYLEKLTNNIQEKVVTAISEKQPLFAYQDKTFLNLYADIKLQPLVETKFTSNFKYKKFSKKIYYLPLFKEMEDYFLSLEPENENICMFHTFSNVVLLNEKPLYKPNSFFQNLLKVTNSKTVLSFPYWRFVNNYNEIETSTDFRLDYFKSYNKPINPSSFYPVPKIEFYSISKYDFNSHIPLIENLKLSLFNVKNGSLMYIFASDFDFTISALYDELLHFATIKQVDDRIFKVDLLDNFEDIVTLDKTKIINYLNDIANDNVQFDDDINFNSFILKFK